MFNFNSVTDVALLILIVCAGGDTLLLLKYLGFEDKYIRSPPKSEEKAAPQAIELANPPSEGVPIPVYEGQGELYGESATPENAISVDIESKLAHQKNDFKVDGDGCIAGCKRSKHLKSWFLTLSFWGITTCILFIPNVYMFIGVALAWLANFIESMTTGTMAYLQANSTGIFNTVKYLQTLRAQPPVITFHAECYHYKTVRTKNGSRRKKVVTHRATMKYPFQTWMDNSIDPAKANLDDYGLIKLKSKKTYAFGNQNALNRFNRVFKQFCADHKRDTHQRYWKTYTVGGFKAKVLAGPSKESVPNWMNAWLFFFYSFFAISPIFRMRMEAVVGRKTYTLRKVICD